MANPYLELTGPSFSISCKPYVDGTETEAKWRSKAGTGRFVKTKSNSIHSQEDGLLEVQLLTGPGDLKNIYGRLESVQGSGDRFTATIMVMGADMWALGSLTGDVALSAGDIGSTVIGAADGKLSVGGGSNGSGRIVGGNKTNLRIAFNGIENVS